MSLKVHLQKTNVTNRAQQALNPYSETDCCCKLTLRQPALLLSNEADFEHRRICSLQPLNLQFATSVDPK